MSLRDDFLMVQDEVADNALAREAFERVVEAFLAMSRDLAAVKRAIQERREKQPEPEPEWVSDTDDDPARLAAWQEKLAERGEA